MYLILISFALAAAVVAIEWALEMIVWNDPLYAAIGVASFIVVFVASFALLGRYFTKGLELTMKQVEKHLGQRKFDLGLKTLREAQGKYKNWHPFVGKQISSQIGQLLYVQGKTGDALPYLQNAIRWDWVGRTMLGCAYHKRKDPDNMRKTLEEVSHVRSAKKEPLFWTVYAYLLRKNGNKDEAQKVLQRAIKHNPEDKRLQNSLQSLQSNKRMKVKVYGAQWQQFRL